MTDYTEYDDYNYKWTPAQCRMHNLCCLETEVGYLLTVEGLPTVSQIIEAVRGSYLRKKRFSSEEIAEMVRKVTEDRGMEPLPHSLADIPQHLCPHCRAERIVYMLDCLSCGKPYE